MTSAAASTATAPGEQPEKPGTPGTPGGSQGPHGSEEFQATAGEGAVYDPFAQDVLPAPKNAQRALLRSLFPTWPIWFEKVAITKSSYFVPNGILLMSLGVLYVVTSLLLVSEFRLVVLVRRRGTAV